MTRQRPAPEADPATRPDMEAILGGRRMRRNRRTDWSRRLVRENTLSVNDLIWPIFLVDGKGITQAVPSMPGVDRLSVDRALAAVERAAALRIPAIALFPYTDPDLRDPTGSEAINQSSRSASARNPVKS